MPASMVTTPFPSRSEQTSSPSSASTPTGNAPHLLKLGVLISGRGSNLRAIVESIERGELAATVEVVICNRADAAGLRWAQQVGLRTSLLSRDELPDRA